MKELWYWIESSVGQVIDITITMITNIYFFPILYKIQVLQVI